MRAFGKRCDVQIRIHDLNLIVHLQIARFHFAGTYGVDADHLRLFGKELRRQQLDVQNQLGDVFLDARNRRKLMLHALDTDAGCRYAGERIEHDSAKRVAQRLTKAALQRIYDKFSISAVLADLDTFDFGFFDLIDHSAFPPL